MSERALSDTTQPENAGWDPAGVEPLLSRYRELLETLHAERAALVERTPDALAAVLERKEFLCAEIDGAQRRMAVLEPSERQRPALDPLREVAERCRDENALNGRIAHRAKQTAQSLLRMLTGEGATDLYGKMGDTRPSHANATRGQHLGSA